MNQKYVIVIMGKLSELEARIEALNTTKKRRGFTRQPRYAATPPLQQVYFTAVT
jgi:hypothetical protein